MKTINKNYDNEIIIKNSRFICYLIKINSENINDNLEEIKKIHPKATHYCYGYIYNDIKKSNDDGEPSGTAGFPILNVIEKENLNHILVIVVRYFGGIKLGAGGLVRAYTKSVTETLKQCNYINLKKGYKISINFEYKDEKNINYIIRNSNIIKKEYNDDIYYEVLINEETLKKLSSYNIKILEETLVEED